MCSTNPNFFYILLASAQIKSKANLIAITDKLYVAGLKSQV